MYEQITITTNKSVPLKKDESLNIKKSVSIKVF